MLNTAVRNTNKLVREQSKEKGIRIGNRFTKKEIARRMASCLRLDGREVVKILDPGAGTGILTAAAVEAFARAGAKEIYADLYETDTVGFEILDKNLHRVRRICFHNYGVKFRYRVINEDFVKAFAPSAPPPALYDAILLNPDDELPESGEVPAGYEEIFRVPVSTAYLFFAASLRALAPGGQLVSVLPTAFATAESVTRCRQFLFGNFAVPEIHLYSERDKIVETTGERRDALRKNMLVYAENREKQNEILLSDSYDFDKTETSLPPLPFDFAVRGEEKRVLLLQSEKDLAVVRATEALPETLSSLGLSMHTGLVLPSRYPDLLFDAPGDGRIPLISASHFRDGRVAFPLGDKKEYIFPRIPSLRQPNKNMLLVKRVPPKSDNRHLSAVVYLSSQFPFEREISTDNKILYVVGDGEEMDAAFLNGLYACVNSTAYERYLSILSRSPQVNAKEYRDLPLPNAETLRKIGMTLMTTRQYSARVSDHLVENALRLSDAAENLAGSAEIASVFGG